MAVVARARTIPSRDWRSLRSLEHEREGGSGCRSIEVSWLMKVDFRFLVGDCSLTACS